MRLEPVLLEALVEELGGRLAAGAASAPTPLSDVVLDSRLASPGALFAASRGLVSDGARFVADALDRGASAVLCDRALEPGTLAGGAPLWIHPEVRPTAGLAADRVHGRPSLHLLVVAITGTNGKTSVAHLVAQLLEAGGRTPALLGTVGHRLAGGARLDAPRTTPESTELHRLLARHLAAGGDSAVLEASSHGLAQDRLAGVAVDVAVFTNLSRDHLDYHGDMDAYRAAKRRLFEGLEPGACAVVNADDPAGEEMAAAALARGARVIRTAVGGEPVPGADELRALDVRATGEGTAFLLAGLEPEPVPARFPHPGRHALENALAAAAVARAVGFASEPILTSLSGATAAPGRLERVDAADGPHSTGPAVYVDYAHTEQALERVLVTLREGIERTGRGGRLVCVFGCGGERDRGKRPAMGAVAGRFADAAILTSDNPRGEDPDAILAEVLAGFGRAGVGSDRRARVEVEPDRAAAIRRAIASAGPADVVLIAGKGHEAWQEVGGERRPFDDRAVAREAREAWEACSS